MLKALVDVDGVIADFYMSALRVCGATKDECERIVEPGDWHVTRAFYPQDSDFWGMVDKTPDFWEFLDETKEAHQILEACENQFKDRIRLLTAPPLSPESYRGKALWIKRHFPRYYRKLFIGPSKEFLAHPGMVLIDDSDKNCDLFKSEGGQAIVVARRWNSLHEHQTRTVDRLKEDFAKLIDNCS